MDQLTEQAQRELMDESIWQDLTTRFAPYLEQYPGVSIIYRGKPLKGVQEGAEVFDLGAQPVELTVRPAPATATSIRRVDRERSGQGTGEPPPALRPELHTARDQFP